MKNLNKVIAITTVAAMSFGCLSVYAAGMPEKAGQMPFRSVSAKAEMKTGANNGAVDKTNMNTVLPENRLNNKNMSGNIGGEMGEKVITAIGAEDFMRSGKGGKGMKGEMTEKAEMTEEEKAAKIEELKADLAEKLETGEITQEKYNEIIAAIKAGDFMRGGNGGKGVKGEMTEEEKVAKIEKRKADLAEKLETGEITQEKYDEIIAAIEAGDFMRSGKNVKGMKGKMTKKAEMTEEEKAAKIEELKADLAEKLEAGEITQEKYDEIIAAINAGNFMRGGKGGRSMKGAMSEKADQNVIS